MRKDDRDDWRNGFIVQGATTLKTNKNKIRKEKGKEVLKNTIPALPEMTMIMILMMMMRGRRRRRRTLTINIFFQPYLYV